jgi:hypothetical protein
MTANARQPEAPQPALYIRDLCLKNLGGASSKRMMRFDHHSDVIYASGDFFGRWGPARWADPGLVWCSKQKNFPA